jgi:RNA polymerase sigma-70 factor (ECF subfamily)
LSIRHVQPLVKMTMNEPVADLAVIARKTSDWSSSKFGSLYNEHSRAIYYLTLRFMGDPQKAEDATHDVF